MTEILYLFTAEYPYGSGEAIIENEITILAGKFDKIVIYPHNASGNKRALPENVEIRVRKEKYSDFRVRTYLMRYFLSVLSIYTGELLHVRNKSFFIKRSKHWISLLCKAFYDAEYITSSIGNDNTDQTYFYSYWNNDWAVALAILVRNKSIRNFVTRSGGFDIYDERHPGNYLPFRKFVYTHCSRIMPNSKVGESYIRGKGIFPDRVHHAYLGTTDHGMNPYDPVSTLVVVSAANMIPLKRLALTIDLLSKLPFPLKWIHFGDGPLKSELEEYAKKCLGGEKSFEFKGSVSNSSLLDFYKHTSVDLFVTTSFTEGLPVSVQEAISFGIPVVATNVGGTGEVVNERTGYLLDRDFILDKEAISAISNFISNRVRNKDYRVGVRNFWAEQFDANIVYSRFCKILRNYPGSYR